MPVFKFAVTVPTTMTATVEVEADTVEQAHAAALDPSFFRDPKKATFELDEGNVLEDAYIPDESDYEEVASPSP